MAIGGADSITSQTAEQHIAECFTQLLPVILITGNFIPVYGRVSTMALHRDLLT